MKKPFLILLLFLFLTHIAFSQIGYHHSLRQRAIENYGFRLVSVSGTPTVIRNVNLCTVRRGVVTVTDGRINVDLWQINDRISCPNGITASTPLTNLQIVDGRATYGTPTRVLVLPFTSINLGVHTLPFRVRFKVTPDSTKPAIPATGTSDFQLAVNVGYTFRFSRITIRDITDWSATIGGYIRPSTAELKEETVLNPATWTANQRNATLTYGVNLLLAQNNLGLVFAYGFEKALGNNRKEWIYNNKPYVGFGINISFM